MLARTLDANGPWSEASPETARARPLVSVIIPAYNASAFIAETLASARAQTWPNLEIIVVDDGSTDDTAAIVEAAAATDPRITLIRQANAGVAAARNRAITAAKGDYVAPLDADDLWHPENVEAQVEALERAGPAAVLAYAWHFRIDTGGVVLSYGPRSMFERQQAVRIALIQRNFIGNASACVIRRRSLLSAGGYDASLRARAAQGYEDLALYLALADQGDFVSVQRFFVGYRRHPDCMSSDMSQMLRSCELSLHAFHGRHPELPSSLFSNALARQYGNALVSSLRRDRGGLWLLLRQVAERDIGFVLRTAGHAVRAACVFSALRLRRARQVLAPRNSTSPGRLPQDWLTAEPLRRVPESSSVASQLRHAG
jgi:glycosyltransferase involved in cell wall biosynthesis